MNANYPVTPWTGTEEDAARALEYEESQIDENNPEVMGKVKFGEYAITEDDLGMDQDQDLTMKMKMI